MMGIGIGIDYALLMVTRFREWRAVGLDPSGPPRSRRSTPPAAPSWSPEARSSISMLGLFAMGLSFMRGAALVTILAVLVVMAASITLFPALLGYLGRHVDRLRLPLGRAPPVAGRRRRARRAVARLAAAGAGSSSGTACVAALAGVAILLALAAPFLGVRFGFPDAGNNREGTSTRQAYDLLADGVRRRRRTARCCWSPSCPPAAATSRSTQVRGALRVDPGRRRRHARRRSTRPATPRSSPCPDHRAAGRRAPRTSCTSCATPCSRPRPRHRRSTCTSAA